MKGKVLRKDASETKERIIKAVKAACDGRCETVTIKESKSTVSIYFTISNGLVEKSFRISDHPTKQKINNFTVSKNTKMDSVANFASSMVKRMHMYSYYHLLESIGSTLYKANGEYTFDSIGI